VPVHALVALERERRLAALIGIECGEKAVGALRHARCPMDVVHMDLLGVARA